MYLNSFLFLLFSRTLEKSRKKAKNSFSTFLVCRRNTALFSKYSFEWKGFEKKKENFCFHFSFFLRRKKRRNRKEGRHKEGNQPHRINLYTF